MTAAIAADFRCSQCGSRVNPPHSHGLCSVCGRATLPPDPLAAMLLAPALEDERSAVYERVCGTIPYQCGDGGHPHRVGYQGPRGRHQHPRKDVRR